MPAEINQLGLEIMDNLFLSQLVAEPTHGNNILDLLFFHALILCKISMYALVLVITPLSRQRFY